MKGRHAMDEHDDEEDRNPEPAITVLDYHPLFHQHYVMTGRGRESRCPHIDCVVQAVLES